MTNYREILRLFSQGISQRSIAASCDCSRNTIAKVLKRSQEVHVAWPLKPEITNGELHQIFFPVSTSSSSRKRPDCEYTLYLYRFC
jgi:hypothetical protein